MKLKDLKEILNGLTEEQLEGNLLANGQYASGCVHEVKPSETNLYYLEDDDPAELIDEAEMKQRVEEEGDDEMPEPYIKKGELLLNFQWDGKGFYFPYTLLQVCKPTDLKHKN